MRLFSRWFKNAVHTEVFQTATRWFLFSAIIGILGGLASIAFYSLVHAGMTFFLDYLAGFRPPEPAGSMPILEHFATSPKRWLLVLLPAGGGLISGAIVYFWAPEAKGHGTDAVIDAFHNKKGEIRPRVPFIKGIASALLIGTGGSGGMEGPIAQIGAGIGSFFADKLKLSIRDRRILLAAGLAAGIGAVFRAPLAGALFAAEVLYKDTEFEADVIVPAALSSIISYSIFCSRFGWSHLFSTVDFHFTDPTQLVPYTLLGLVLGFAAIFFNKSFYGIHNFFERLKVPGYLKPAIGGLITGCIGYFIPEALAIGYGAIQQGLYGEIAASTLLIIAVAKMASTSFSVGSGGSAGLFGPSMVIGACVGGSLGLFLHAHFPSLVPYSGPYFIVGMAGFFAGAAHVPISTLIMVGELTGNYHLIVPTLWVCTISFLICRKSTLYRSQVNSQADSPAHRGEFLVDVLEQIKVKDIFKPGKFSCVSTEDTLKQLKNLISRTTQRYFPVKDNNDRFIGILSMSDVRPVLNEPGIEESVIVHDFYTKNMIVINTTDTLDLVMKKFTIKNLDSIPVVEKKAPKKLLGFLSRREVIAAYNKRLLEIKEMT